MTMNKQKKAYFLAITSVLFWSTMGTVFKLSLNYLSPSILLLYSTFIALTFLITSVLLKKKIKLLCNLRARYILNSALMGFFNPFLYYMVLFKAYSLIQAQEAVTLNYLWPVMLVLFSMLFLKQPVKFISIIAILVSFFGTFIIASHGNILNFRFTNAMGVALASGSSLIWATFWILNLKDEREEESKMLLNFVFGFLYTLIWNLLNRNISFILSPGMIGALLIGIFEMGLTFVLWLTALKLSTTTVRISNLVFLSPFISLCLIGLFVGEKIYIYTIVGLIFIVSGIFLQNLPNLRKQKEDLM
jgi:drug/metabolite transporter (DMT)-like permease